MLFGTSRCHLRIPMVFEEAMRKYDAKNPMTGHGGRRSLCCSCMTMRMQKRDSFVTGHFPPYMPEFAVLPRGRFFGVPVHGRRMNTLRHLPTTGNARAAL